MTDCIVLAHFILSNAVLAEIISGASSGGRWVLQQKDLALLIAKAASGSGAYQVHPSWVEPVFILWFGIGGAISG
jgi:hypothetical protein